MFILDKKKRSKYSKMCGTEKYDVEISGEGPNFVKLEVYIYTGKQKGEQKWFGI